MHPSRPAESEVTLGEYKVEITGRDRMHVKRRALDYWFRHRGALNCTVRDFLEQCRLSTDEKTITFLQRPLAR